MSPAFNLAGINVKPLSQNCIFLAKRTEEEKNTQHPTFEEGFTFVVHDLETLGDSAINLEVLEGESTFGSVQLQLSELMESPIKKKLEKIRPDHEGCMATMTLSAKIEFA